ncbi:MAG: hypothetical protein HeimC2_45480 [Candidatus Heimdallarchaeota archaeon LC_2]|nr:MAG: hypothetical protein HeimC2_45480 [Candidatus Heimdallarchaeota archaeon LC_2]
MTNIEVILLDLINANIISENGSSIDEDDAKKLIEFWVSSKKHYFLQERSASITAAGQFCERYSKILHFICYNNKGEEFSFGPRIERIQNNCRNSLPDEIRMTTTRVLRSCYQIRTKRDAAHDNGITNNTVDLIMTVSMINWLLIELLINYANVQEDEMKQFESYFSNIDIPIIEYFEGKPTILKPDLATNKHIYLHLLVAKENKLTLNELDILINHTRRRIGSSLNYEKNLGCLYQSTEGWYKLSRAGFEKAKIIMIELTNK